MPEKVPETPQLDPTAECAESQKVLEEKLLELQKSFQEKFTRDHTLKEAYDKLYAEMRQYKDNFLYEAQRPLLMDIILLYDNLLRTEKRFEEKEVREGFSFLKEELLEILYRQDIEPIQIDEKKVNKKLQRTIKTVETHCEEEHGDVVEIVREGFLRNDRVMRPQEIICKKYKTQEPPIDEGVKNG